MGESEFAVIARRLDVLESRVAIWELCAELMRGTDGRDLLRVLNAWHEDGVWDLGQHGTFRGHGEIAAFFESTIWPTTPRMHHWGANAVIRVEGDWAWGRSDTAIGIPDASGPLALTAVSFDDVYERRRDTWRISERRIITYGV